MKDYLDEYIIATRLIHRNCGATIEELSEALDKTPRAVFSILNQLDSMMFPIYDMPDPDNPNLILPGTVLTIPSLYGEYREGTFDPGKKYDPLIKN